MFVVSMLVNKTKTSVSLPFCPAASPSRLPCPHPHSSRLPPPPAKTGRIPHVPLAPGRAFSLYARRHPTPTVPSPIWNNKIFFRFDFTDFALPYEELFGAPEPEPEQEPEVKEIVSSCGSSRYTPFCFLPPWPWFPMAFASVRRFYFHSEWWRLLGRTVTFMFRNATVASCMS
jgi:hypothetical protein